jgi:inositol phosphorylceramide mannosyltransferase catalytic subunit
MRHYGGVYLDLDNVRCLFFILSFPLSPIFDVLKHQRQYYQGCLENLTPLLYYPAWTTDGGRGALSNNILGSQPNHPFWKLLTDSLITYDYNYLFPYVTISYASGQWFETAIWQEYHSSATPENHLYRIMMDDRPGTDPWIFFTQARGGTWKNWDNAMFLWVGDHLVLLALVIVGGPSLLCWACLPLGVKTTWIPGMFRNRIRAREHYSDKFLDEA